MLGLYVAACAGAPAPLPFKREERAHDALQHVRATLLKLVMTKR